MLKSRMDERGLKDLKLDSDSSSEKKSKEILEE